MTSNISISSSFAPGFLIATPNLIDPGFAQSIVLVAKHNEEGAMGFICNRTGPLSLGQILDRTFGDSEELPDLEDVQNEEMAGAGGPVQPGSVWILYRREEGFDDDMSILMGEELAIGNSRPLLLEFATGIRSSEFLVLLGYSGWGAGQLEEEAISGSWIPADLDLDILFEVDREHRWEVALRRQGFVPGGFLMGSSKGLN